MKYTPTETDYDLVERFATTSAFNHFAGSRDYEGIVDDIVIGKLGEIAYKSWMGDDVSDPDLTFRENADPGWDFVDKNGIKIQVKTLRSSTKWVTFYNWNWDRLEIIRFDGQDFIHIRSVHREEVQKIARPSKFRGHYFKP